MSLLLDALKKAEKAKEEAQRRASGAQAAPQAPASASPALQLQAEEPRHVMTRPELPQISHGLEILSDDLAPKEAAQGGGAARQSASPRDNPAPTAAQAQAAPRPETVTAAQRAGRKVFEVKFKESNPRLPFYITLAALGLFALGTVGYFWYQLRPPAPLVNANPKPPAEERPVAAAPAPATSSSALSAGATTTAPGAAAGIPGLPQASAPATPATAAPVAAAPVEPKAAAAPAARTPPTLEAAKRITAASTPATPAAAAPRRTVREARRDTVTSARPVAQVHPKVESGYAAYLAGDVTRARADYQDALRDDPGNRDALLGLAAADVRSGRFETAEATYRRVLQMDPRDPHAQAGLISLRSGRIDPVAAESRVKSLLATDPGAHVLYFTLGNQLAQQERWAEAQQQYFKAFAAEPDNPDFAYNLAVSLDQLRQPKLALEYYQRALVLAGKRGASFDAGAARQRIAQLGR